MGYKNRTKHRHSHSYRTNHRTIKRYGGSGCGAYGCPIAPLSFQQMNQFGGSASFYKPAPPMPGPITGAAINYSKLGSWPGVDGIAGNRNYLESYNTKTNNIINHDPALKMSLDGDSGYVQKPSSMVGGYRYHQHHTNKKHHKNKGNVKRRHKSLFSVSLSKPATTGSSRGGGFLPQDLVNLGNRIGYNVHSAYNTLNGYKAPVNPLPFKDQY